MLGEGGGAVSAVFAPADEPRAALASVGNRVFRTFNGGLFWDDITANLPAADVRGITADLASGAVYAATGAGVFVTYVELRTASPASGWSKLDGLPADSPAWDVKLDDGGHQLFVAVDGQGVFAALAPHRRRDPRVVNAADQSVRPAAPGSLLSIMGASLASARVGNLEAPVLGVSGGRIADSGSVRDQLQQHHAAVGSNGGGYGRSAGGATRCDARFCGRLTGDFPGSRWLPDAAGRRPRCTD